MSPSLLPFFSLSARCAAISGSLSLYLSLVVFFSPPVRFLMGETDIVRFGRKDSELSVRDGGVLGSYKFVQRGVDSFYHIFYRQCLFVYVSVCPVVFT